MDTNVCSDNELLPESKKPIREKYGDYRDQFFPGVKIRSKASGIVFVVRTPPELSNCLFERIKKLNPIWLEGSSRWCSSDLYTIVESPDV